jgi:hypothetical protein
VKYVVSGDSGSRTAPVVPPDGHEAIPSRSGNSPGIAKTARDARVILDAGASRGDTDVTSDVNGEHGTSRLLDAGDGLSS